MRAKNRFLFIPVAFFIAFIIIFLTCRLDVFARQSAFSRSTDIAETAYRADLSKTLKSAGIKNAGITMTKLTTDGSNVRYKVDIYLPSYIKLNNAEEAQLLERLSSVEFDVDNAAVSFNFFRERG